MRIQEIMTAGPEACEPGDSCAVAGEIMRRRACGFVPVVDSQDAKRVVGVVTDRDLALYLVRKNQPASQLTVEGCMTRTPRVIAPDADLEAAAALMEEFAVHRLPVVEQGRLVGVLSLRDIARVASRQWAHSGPHIVERQMTEIIEAIAAKQADK